MGPAEARTGRARPWAGDAGLSNVEVHWWLGDAGFGVDGSALGDRAFLWSGAAGMGLGGIGLEASVPRSRVSEAGLSAGNARSTAGFRGWLSGDAEWPPGDEGLWAIDPRWPVGRAWLSAGGFWLWADGAGSGVAGVEVRGVDVSAGGAWLGVDGLGCW
jgi:hypothetical protein